MSSAILYVAIVAIWACVLIPRWLRRDSARGAGAVADMAVPGNVVPGVTTDDVATGLVSDVAGAEETAGTVWTEAPIRSDATVGRDASADAEPREVLGSGASPPAPGEARERMLAARRRLLGMLSVLEIAAIALAVSRFAALWVLIPPTVMFAGYLLLLREAARGDAERARREADAARARARAQERARERAARRTEATRVPAAPFTPAASRHATRYEDANPGGRDFAPGLAGKYTTSNAAVVDIYERPDEDLHDVYAREKLRAVGD